MTIPRRGPGALALSLAVAIAGVGAGCTPLGPAGEPTPRATTATWRPTGIGELRPTGPLQVARVTRITDGDTIRVVLRGREERVRYIGIDTPELARDGDPAEPFAVAAMEANAALVTGREVVLEKDVSETDDFGRLLRYVWLAPARDGASNSDSASRDPAAEVASDGWRLVNLELVRGGYATAVTYPPDVARADLFRTAEREAREAGRGLWAEE